MAVKFEVENVLTIKTREPKPVIMARLVDAGADFWLTENSRLGGVAITKEFTIPRAIDKEGNQRLDLFAFEIKHSDDVNKAQKGEIIELLPGNELELLEPWESADGLATGLGNELTKELHSDHRLFGKTVKAVAKRIDRDDVLFLLSEENKYAVVHLTWRGSQENTARYPTTEFYSHWTDLYEQRVLPDHKDWRD